MAFLGDTDTGSNFKKVLDLVKAEGAEALVVQGDMSYAANPTAWWDSAEAVLGTTFPIFISRGNHDDSSWTGYLPKAAAHLDGATRIAGAHDMGAIVETGHEHSYERTKTLVDITKQIVDSNCDSSTDLCVGPGRTFVNVVGLGGQSIRPQLRCWPASPPYGCVGEWAFIYTTNQRAALGAQFITFNAGDPQKANGYFKNVNGAAVDTFTITADP